MSFLVALLLAACVVTATARLATQHPHVAGIVMFTAYAASAAWVWSNGESWVAVVLLLTGALFSLDEFGNATSTPRESTPAA